MFARVVVYPGTIGTHEEITRLVAEELLPQVRQIPGFMAYHLLSAGPGDVAVISFWESQAGADVGAHRAQAWLSQNPDRAKMAPHPPHVIQGEVLLHVE